MNIAIMSDAHDNWVNLDKAIDLAIKHDCELLLFAGDLIAPPMIDSLARFKCEVQIVWGNNEAEKLGIVNKAAATPNVKVAGDIYESEVAGIKIFMNHYPRTAELAAASGQFNLCIHGHTHDYRNEFIGETIILNPGELQGKRNKPSFAIFDTDDRYIRKVEL